MYMNTSNIVLKTENIIFGVTHKIPIYDKCIAVMIFVRNEASKPVNFPTTKGLNLLI